MNMLRHIGADASLTSSPDEIRIAHSPIMSMADVFADPHYRVREMIIDVPAEGRATVLASDRQDYVVMRLSTA